MVGAGMTTAHSARQRIFLPSPTKLSTVQLAGALFALCPLWTAHNSAHQQTLRVLPTVDCRAGAAWRHRLYIFRDFHFRLHHKG